MIFVLKQEDPDWFRAWKEGASPDWKPTYSALDTSTKTKLKTALIKEQGHVCCYCGGKITSEDSHIEHFRPQSNPEYQYLSVEYKNLFASCIKEAVKGGQLHCGHAKGDSFEEELCISPIDPGCEDHFKYSYHGDISPNSKENSKATHMIELLKLNCASLQSRRRAVLQKVFSVAFIDSATEEELRALRDSYTKQSEGGVRDEFGQVITRFIDQQLL